MAEIGLAASVIAIIQLTASCLKLSRKWIGPSEFSSSELTTLTTALYDFNGAIKTFQTHLEIHEDNEARLVSLEYLENAISRCSQALDIIKQFIERGGVMNRVVLGPKFDRKLKSSLTVLQGAKELFMFAVQADQQSILLGVDSYIRNVAQDIRDIQAIIQHNEARLVEVRKAQTDQASSTERQAVLDWLSRSDYAVVQSDYFNRRHQGTWLWFLESATFTAWLGTSSKTLLCLGIPGVGKTILMSTVVHHLQERYRSDASVKLAYVYLDYGRQDEQSLEQLLSSLLQQACQLESQLPDTVKSLYDHHKEHKMRPSVDELTAALQSVMTSHSRVFILIDALDECRTADGCQSTFLKILTNIQHNSAASIFLTSRIAPDDMREFRDLKSVDICASGSDMREYLNGQMFRLPRVVRQNPELQEQIRTEILGASDGLFLLARLHLDSLLGKKSVKSVKATLSSLPKSSGLYEAAYDVTLVRLRGQDADSVELARQALSWLVSAKRPLTTAELQHALAVEQGTRELDEENLNPIEDIMSVCTGLVTVDKDSDIVRLVHRTAHQYLQHIRQDWFPQADRDIATTCLTYLSFAIFENGSCSTDVQLEERLVEYPLYSYAAHNWAYHARKDGTPTKLVLAFLQNNGLVQAASQATNFDLSRWRPGYSQRIPKQVTGLHLAARFGMKEIMESLLKHEGNVDLDDGQGRTPLSYASGLGQTESVKLLLAKGANAASTDKDGTTPLHYAASNGCVDVVLALFASGAQVDGKGYLHRTALHDAASRGKAHIVKMLLGKGADSEAKDIWGWTPLIHGTVKAHENTVKVLLAAAVSLDAKSQRNGRTALSYAAGQGHSKILRLLLDCGAGVDSKDDKGRTPLTYAAQGGHVASVKILLHFGAETDAASATGRTPLSYSTHARSLDVAKMLLSNGAGVDSKDMTGDTPLCWAAIQGNEEALQYLIAQGAVVSTRGNDGRTLLSYAASNGHDHMVKVLCEEFRLDPDQTDAWDQTPLLRAAREGHVKVVEELIRQTAKLDIKDNVFGQTALSHAAQWGYTSVVQLLIENGADLLSEDMFGQTPLDYASNYKQSAVLELLQQRMGEATLLS